MLEISNKQLAVFSRNSSLDFENRMVAHLRMDFAEHCEHMEELDLRELIRYGIQRAAAHELTWEYEVCLYLHLMLVLGRNFDQDPIYEWIGKLLNGREGSASDRVEAIYDRVMGQDESDERLGGTLLP